MSETKKPELVNKNSTESHPSYCLAQFTRTSSGNGTHLFGTNINPNHYFTFKLQKAVKEVSWTGEERFVPDHKAESRHIIEFSLSANQFAELITTMNMGEGVPVTLTHSNGKRVEKCPSQTAAIENVIDTAERKVLEKTKDQLDRITAALELLEKKSLSKEDKKAITDALTGGVDKIKDSGEFYQKMVEEVGEKLKQEIRTEIDAQAGMAIHKIGLMTLGNEGAINQLLLKPTQKETKKKEFQELKKG